MPVSAYPTAVPVIITDGVDLDTPISGGGGGGGTEYTEGATDASITGTAFMWEDTGNALTPVNATKPLPVALPTAQITTLTPPAAITGFATSTKQDTLAGLVGEVQASPTSNTLLDRVKQLLTGIILAAGENHVGAVGGHTTQLALPTITVSTSPAYSVNDVVGGKLTLASAFRANAPGTALLQSLFLMEAGTQKSALEILIFNADPSGGTYTDNAAFPNNAADMAKCIRRISVGASDWVTVGTYSIADIALGGKPLQVASGTTLYLVIVIGGSSTPTYSATTALSGRIGLLWD